MKNVTMLFLLICWSSLIYGQTEKPKVVSSASMFSDMVQNLAGDFVDMETIVPIGGDPHLHTPTPRDARIVAAADLIFVNSLTFEGWIGELIANSGTSAVIDTITKGINPIASDTYKDSYDPHAWMSAKNGRGYIKNMKNALTKLLPDHAAAIEQNYQAYDKKLGELHSYIQQEINSIPTDKKVLITSHDAFAYFGKEYGIRLEPIIGISTEADVQTSDVRRVNEVIRNNKVPAVFIESTINPKLLKQIAEDNNIAIGGELYADSLGDKDSHGSTYIKMLKHNADTVVAGLTKNKSIELEGQDSKSTTWILYGLIGLLLVGGILFMAKKLS